MHKLTEYADMAATEYFQETGETELDSLWIARFFQDSGVLDDYPRQNLVAFSAMVQKELILRSERAGKESHFRLDKIIHFVKRPSKP